jgi:hypothetical protein
VKPSGVLPHQLISSPLREERRGVEAEFSELDLPRVVEHHEEITLLLGEMLEVELPLARSVNHVDLVGLVGRVEHAPVVDGVEEVVGVQRATVRAVPRSIAHLPFVRPRHEALLGRTPWASHLL